MERMSGQLGFADAAVARHGANARLDRIDALIDWDGISATLAPARGAAEGRPAWPSLMMFKALLLAQWYDLSDRGLEEALSDRLSFRRFCGLSLEDTAPDHTALCRFRVRLADYGLAAAAFAALDAQLQAAGVIVQRGTLIDASLVEAAAARPSRDEGGDRDAAFAKKGSKTVYGYKAHVAVDEASGLVRRADLTAANVADTCRADTLIPEDEHTAVYADAAYDTHARRRALKAAGLKDRIKHRPNRHHPILPPRLALRNKLIERRRAKVETVFAVLKRHYRYVRTRYRGLARNQTQLFLLLFALNARRAERLAP